MTPGRDGALLVELAYQRIRSDILSGRFAWGERLAIPRLVALLGMSRTPVQHALRRLAIEHLVVIRPQSGTYVSSPSVQDILEVHQLRRGLEVLALELAIERLDQQLLDTIEAALNAAEAVDPSVNPEPFFDSDRILHGTLIRSCGNARLAALMETLQNQIELFRMRSFTIANARESMAMHRVILAAIARKDVVGATAALKTHIDQVCAHTVEAFAAASAPRRPLRVRGRVRMGGSMAGSDAG